MGFYSAFKGLIFISKQLGSMFPWLPHLVLVSSQHTSLFSQLPDLTATSSQPAFLFPLLNPSCRVSIASQYIRMFLFPKGTCQ
jgi:hypothetical protein